VNAVESNGIQWNPIPFLGIEMELELKIQNFSITI
jgi:hypothetical protein